MGNFSSPSNYRPIFLTSIVCKILEHAIHTSIISHLERNNILKDCQHGFRKRRSCETQLILTNSDLARGLNDKQQIDAILLDFSKALDRVPHQRLLLKLKHFGIWGTSSAGLEICFVRESPGGHHRRLNVITFTSHIRCPSRHSLRPTPVPGL